MEKDCKKEAEKMNVFKSLPITPENIKKIGEELAYCMAIHMAAAEALTKICKKYIADGTDYKPSSNPFFDREAKAN